MAQALLPAVEINPESPQRYTVIWLHGLGADGYDFVPIVHELALTEPLGLRFVFPHAPEIPVTINGGYQMPAWYDILGPDLARSSDSDGVAASVAAVRRLMQREIAAGKTQEQIILAGFSQGGVIALHTALRDAAPVAGVIALSTYLPLVDRLPPPTFGLPVFWGHGTQDTVVPPVAADLGEQWLAEAGHQLTRHTYPMAHAVCPEEIEHLRSWMLDRFA